MHTTGLEGWGGGTGSKYIFITECLYERDRDMHRPELEGWGGRIGSKFIYIRKWFIREIDV